MAARGQAPDTLLCCMIQYAKQRGTSKAGSRSIDQFRLQAHFPDFRPRQRGEPVEMLRRWPEPRDGRRVGPNVRFIDSVMANPDASSSLAY